MMKSNHSITGEIAFALGKGIIAGLAGTAAISVAQMIDMKVTGREPSDAPAKAVNKVLNVEATDEEQKEKFIQEVHWTYGTLWGLARGVLDLMGVRGARACAAHWAAIWGTEMIMLPSLKVAPPVKEWGGKEIAKDGLMHVVYAVAAGTVYDAIE
jgi:hypothetical protein